MSDDLTWLPAWEIRDRIATGAVSARAVTDHFLARVEAFQPTLHAFRHVDAAGACSQADAADARAAQGAHLGGLHGIPVAVKENVAVAGMPYRRFGTTTTSVASRDGLVVERLRSAGAVIVGITSMMGIDASPFEGGRPRQPWVYPEFNWDAEARNPWDPARVPGWSSAGSAAAAAARLVPITIGSDGGGSTRLPAAYCGLVGIHPTQMLVPQFEYDTPGHPSLIATVGPLCRDVRDAAITLQAIAGPDGRDFTALQSEPPDYQADLEAGVEGMRMAWTDDFGFASVYAQDESARVIEHVRDAAQGFSALGATVAPTDAVWRDVFTANTDTKFLWGDNDTAPAPAEWAAALDLRQHNWLTFREVLREHDVVLTVTSQIVAKPIEEWNDSWRNPAGRFHRDTFAATYCSHTMLLNWMGFPAFSVPCGFVDGLPVGLQVTGWPGSEPTLFRVAAAFQRAFPQLEHPSTS